MQIMDFARAAVPKPVKAYIKRRLGMPLTRLHPDWEILAPIGPVFRKHVVFDLGAHHGWFFHCWQDWCPDAEIHAFEPDPQTFAEMRRHYGEDNRVKLNSVGVGDVEGTLELNVVCESRVANSFLRLRNDTWREAWKFDPATAEIPRTRVGITTLDAYCSQQGISSIYLIKIDVQGYELKVLESATITLPKTDHLLVEAGILPFYEGAPRFTEVFEYLTAKGFHLMAMRAWHRGNHKLMETDMLFRRDDLAPPVPGGGDRIMETLA